MRLTLRWTTAALVMALFTTATPPGHAQENRPATNLGCLISGEDESVSGNVPAKSLGEPGPDSFRRTVIAARSALQCGDLDSAEKLSTSGLEIALRNGTATDIATAMNIFASVKTARGDLTSSENLYKRILDDPVYASAMSARSRAFVLNNYAGVLVASGKAREAKAAATEAVSILRADGGSHLAIALDSLGAAQLQMGDHPGALQSYDAALMLMQREPVGHLGLSMNIHRANVLCEQSRRNEGVQSLRDSTSQLSDLIVSKAEPLYVEALSHLTLCLGQLDESRLVEIHEDLWGAVEAISLRLDGLRSPEFGSDRSAALGSREKRLIQLYLLVSASILKGASIDHATMASRSFIAAQLLTDFSAAEAMAKSVAKTASFSGPAAELIRAEIALDSELAAEEAEYLAILVDPDSSRERVRESSNALMQRQAAIQAVRSELDARFPRYRRVLSRRPVRLDEAQRLLRDGEGLLLMVEFNRYVYIVAVSKDEVELFSPKLVPGEIAGLLCNVDAIRCDALFSEVPEIDRAAYLSPKSPFEKIGFPRYDAWSAYQIYSAIFAPLESIFKGDTVLVVQAGAVAELPLQMLVRNEVAEDTDEADPAVLSGLDWLGNHFAFNSMPTVSGLRLREAGVEAKGAVHPFLGVGDPVLTGTSACPTWAGDGPEVQRGKRLANGDLRLLCPLPGTRQELEAAADIFGGSAKLKLGSAATEAGIKNDPALDKAGTLMFATHGVFAGQAGSLGIEEPGLVLTPPSSPTPEDDGMLEASEVLRLNLTADWVILSGCNTASALGGRAEDSLSALARAFMFAGARAVLASHWSVSDESTAALTTEVLLFKRRNPQASKAAALRAATASLRTGVRADGSKVPGWKSEWVHPMYWAPFSNYSYLGD